MPRVVHVDSTAEESIQREVLEIGRAWREALSGGRGFCLGGATGRTHLALYRELFKLTHVEADLNAADVRAYFLDEYWAAPLYWNYARQHLRVGQPEGFSGENVWLPRGSFFEETNGADRLVDSDRLEAILRETRGEWEPRTEPGDDGVPPEVHILQGATHPVLKAVRESLARYDRLVRTEGAARVQLLGIGTQGHIGFVERGAAAAGSGVMLVRLCPTTQADNAADFRLVNGDGHEVQLTPSRFAVTQGIGSILSARTLLLAAHGPKKRGAIRRMLLEPAGPQNPAAFATQHDNLALYLDEAAFGDLSPGELRDRGYEVEINGARASVRSVDFSPHEQV